MTVVSDSSPLITLARIGQLNLLAAFYKRILIPPEVQDEVVVAGHGLPGAKAVQSANWIEVVPQKSAADSSLAQACKSLGLTKAVFVRASIGYTTRSEEKL